MKHMRPFVTHSPYVFSGDLEEVQDQGLKRYTFPHPVFLPLHAVEIQGFSCMCMYFQAESLSTLMHRHTVAGEHERTK
jgi:hypothetical protein